MSIKAGAILFDANGFVLDRIQNGGPGQLNIPEEKIREVGNWNQVGTVYDIADLSFDLESYDVSPEFEFLITGVDPTTGSAGQAIDFQDAYALDILSPFKSLRNQYDINSGVVVPYLTLESAQYSFGVGSSASQNFSLKGDSIYWCPGQPIMERQPVTGGSSSEEIFFGGSDGAADAAEYNGGGTGSTEFVLSACLYNLTDGTQQRLFPGSGIDSQDINGFVVSADIATDYEYVQYTYSLEQGDTTGPDYTQDVHAGTDAFTPGTEGGPLATDVNTSGGGFASDSTSPYNAGVKPAAVRAKDIHVYTAAQGADFEDVANWSTLSGIQNIDATWSVSLENDEELGNSRYVDQDYDVPEVTGSMTVKAYNSADLATKINLVTGVPADEVVGPNITDPIQLRITINDPASPSTVIKSLYVPDARFTVPGMNPQVGSKLESQFDYTSDTGSLTVYKGDFAS